MPPDLHLEMVLEAVLIVFLTPFFSSCSFLIFSFSLAMSSFFVALALACLASASFLSISITFLASFFSVSLADTMDLAEGHLLLILVKSDLACLSEVKSSFL